MIFYYLFIFSLPYVSHPILELTLGGLTVLKYLGLICLLRALVELGISRTKPSYFATGQARAFVVLFILLTLSYWTASISRGADINENPYVVFLSMVAFFFATLTLINSLERLRKALLAAMGGIGFASLYVLKEWQGGITVYGQGYRPGAVTGDPNFFAASAILCLPLAYFCARGGASRSERLFCLGCGLVTLAAYMVAQSRGGFLGLMAATLFVVWHSPARTRHIVSIVSVLLVFALIMPSSPLDRLIHPRYGDTQSTENHLLTWDAAWRMALDHPVLGVGLGNFRYQLGTYLGPDQTLRSMVHNTYLDFAAEIGVPGLLAFLCILVLSLRSLDRLRRGTLESERGQLPDAILGIQAGLVGFAVAIFFISAYFLKLFWFMVFISMCLPSVLPVAQPHTVRRPSEHSWRDSPIDQLADQRH